jgi:vacuolar-type H+-ATPase subunit H
MEARATEEKEVHEARMKVRTHLARATRAIEQLAGDEDISDIPPHLLGR